jgi:polyhydroxybutyrate depolymerase
MGKHIAVALTAVLIHLTACNSGAEGDDEGGIDGGGGDGGRDAGRPLVCPATDLAAGTTHPVGNAEFSIQHGGKARTFKVHVPAGYAGTAAVPLVIVSHGLTQNATQSIRGTDMVPAADAGGFIAVFPNGVDASWNAGACCSDNVEDDVGFIRAIIDHLGAELGLCVDRTRVYATGFSNGAMLSYRLACEASDLFAAIVSVAGSLAVSAESCASSQIRPVPLLAIHGVADSIVSYEQSMTSVDAYAALSGCGTTSHPATQPVPTHADTTCVTRDACPAATEVTTCSIDDGGHCWFGNDTCGTGVPGGELFVGNNAMGIITAEAAWGFLSRFSCPACGG